MSLFNVNGWRLNKKLHKTEKSHACYTSDLDVLKECYLKIYDKESVDTLIEVVRENGHPQQVEFINEFSVKYLSGNFDELDIKIFKKLFDNYNDKFLEKRSKKGA